MSDTVPNEHEQLDRDALLMLYAADELVGEDRVAFEAQLASDASLRAELDRVRAVMEASDRDLAQLDQSHRLPTNEGVAVRRAGRAITQWTVERNAKVEAPPKQRMTIPWWSYPAAVAAAVITGFLIWSGHQEVQPVPPANNSVFVQGEVDDVDELANRLNATFEAEESTIVAVDDSPRVELMSMQDESDPFFLGPREELAQ